MSLYEPGLSGTEWQEWANNLLILHYGPTNYQIVPDEHKGDAGIEGFTISEGHAYQAYGCEGEPLDINVRYEHQRDKMSDDIRKFIKNSAFLEKLFGNVKITRWVLFVPFFNSKDLVAHAAKKTKEVINAKLPYVSDEFRVVVNQEEHFIVERNILINAGSKTLEFKTKDATSKDIAEWASSNIGFAAALDSKIRKLPTLISEEQRQQFHQQVLKWYLEGQAILEALRQYPDVFEKVIRAKSHRENFLVMASLSGSAPQAIFQSSIQELLATLKSEVRELHSYSAESLAYEAVADWLLRCPLNFP